MRIIEPSVELVGGNVGLFDRPKHVELCGRVCYKSESKIAEDSAEKFIAGIIKRGHEAVLEHARITLDLSTNRDTWRMLNQMRDYMQKRGVESYLRITNWDSVYIASGNVRAWRALCKFMFYNGHLFPDSIKRMWAENAPFFPEYFKEEPYIPDTITDINPDKDTPTFEDPAQRMMHSWYTLCAFQGLV